MGLVYEVQNVLNGKRYIGYTDATLQQRWAGHLKALARGVKSRFYDAVRSYGLDAFSLRVVASDVNIEYEREMILLFKTTNPNFGYNMYEGGKVSPVKCEEVRARISATLTGRSLSEATRKKMSSSHRGQVLSAETRLKLSEATKGRSKSITTRNKMSDAAYKRDPSTRRWSEAARKNHVASMVGHKDFCGEAGHKKQAESLRRTLALKM